MHSIHHRGIQNQKISRNNRIRFRKFSASFTVVASRIYFSPSPCYRPRLCVHPMATSTPPTHPKTLIYLLDVSPSTTAFDPSAFISPPDEQKFSAFTIPSAIVSLSSHSTEPDQIPPERSTQGEMSIFLLISLVRSVDRVCS